LKWTNLNRFTFYKKVSRWSAAILIVIAFLSLISGFGLTNPVVAFRLTSGLLERGLSYNLHIVWTPLLFMVFTWLHVFPRLVMESKGIKTRRPELLEAFILAVGIVSFVYFYVLSIPFRV
jgi:cytochrome b subunit of formate dehydrogenase